jgi:uncharacterized protein (TIGR00297 family)
VLGAFASAVGVVATVVLAVASVVARALTPLAAAVAAAFGITIVVFAGFGFLILLVVFVVVSSLATRYRFAEKARRHVQEGRAGERGVSNVLAHIVLPTAIALGGGLGWIAWPTTAVLFACALAFAHSDTLASEFGVLNGSAVSILSLRPVAPGTNGGVSTVGQMFAVAGAAGTALVGLAVFGAFGEPVGAAWAFLLAVGVAGFLACQVDSVLGETLENRGYLTKGGTNFLGMLSAMAIGAGVLALAGAAA